MAGARYYRVGPAFWSDHPSWGDDERLAALYILTSPHRSTEGLFRMPLAYAAADLGWLPERFAQAFERLIADGFVEYDYDASVCLIVNALAWQAPENPNQARGAVKAVAELPRTPLLQRFLTLAETHSQRLAQALREGLPRRFAQSPAPSPSPRTTPPQPPASGGSRPRRRSSLPEGSALLRPSLAPPRPPVGDRQRDLAKHAEAVAEHRRQLVAFFASPAGQATDGEHSRVLAMVGELAAQLPSSKQQLIAALHAHHWDGETLIVGTGTEPAWQLDRLSNLIDRTLPAGTRWQAVECGCSNTRLEAVA